MRPLMNRILVGRTAAVCVAALGYGACGPVADGTGNGGASDEGTGDEDSADATGRATDSTGASTSGDATTAPHDTNSNATETHGREEGSCGVPGLRDAEILWAKSFSDPSPSRIGIAAADDGAVETVLNLACENGRCLRGVRFQPTPDGWEEIPRGEWPFTTDERLTESEVPLVSYRGPWSTVVAVNVVLEGPPPEGQIYGFGFGFTPVGPVLGGRGHAVLAIGEGPDGVGTLYAGLGSDPGPRLSTGGRWRA